MKVDEFYCGRRVSNTLSPGPDLWVKSPRDEYHHCSYCGSLHPETFLKFVREGVKIGPTDKSYKFYIDLPGNHQLMCHASRGSLGPGFTAYADLNHEQKMAVKRVWRGKGYKEQFYGMFESQDKVHEKFYTHHLVPPHNKEFSELYYSRLINWGNPGYPYTQITIPD